VPPLGQVDLGLSLFYTGLLILLIVVSYLSLIRRNRGG
jgi:hypothetical protein